MAVGSQTSFRRLAYDEQLIDKSELTPVWFIQLDRCCGRNSKLIG